MYVIEFHCVKWCIDSHWPKYTSDKRYKTIGAAFRALQEIKNNHSKFPDYRFRIAHRY
jgi:hypothetical protein